MDLKQWQKLLRKNSLMEANDSKVFDITTVNSAVEELQKKINAPYAKVYHSTLGGESHVSILINFSLDREDQWGNGIVNNSRYVKLHFENDGDIELIHQFMGAKKRFRKVRAKSVDDAIIKINKWIAEVK